jgi:hypothetical protein
VTRLLPAWVATLAYAAAALTVGIAVGIVIAPMPAPLVVAYCPAPVFGSAARGSV